jgi:GT2 family glycosyltransferase
MNLHCRTDDQKIYIIVLTWNQHSLTVDCVRSLMNLDDLEHRVVVVDNGSQDGTVEKLQAQFGEQIDLIANRENLGFGGGNNIGIRYALDRGADCVMLLNNDTVVDPEFLQPLVSVLQSNKQIGAVTPKIYFMHDPQRIWAAGGEIHWWLGRVGNRGYNQLDCGQFDQAELVDYAPGCCLLFSRAALEKVGLLDERYFAYFEDTDWSMRARQYGFEIWYEPTSKIWHVSRASLPRASPFLYYLGTRNTLWFIRRYGEGMARLTALVRFGFRRVLCSSLALLVSRRWDKLKCLWRGARDGWRKLDRC